MSLKWHKKMSQLCVGCGLCLGICPVNAVKIKNQKGIITVTFNYTRCTNCGICVKACPSLFNLYTQNMTSLDDLGKVIKILFGYSTNTFIRYHGASGGVVTSLLLYMLKTGMADEAFVVKVKNFTSYTMLTNNKDEIISAQGSIYFKTFSLAFLPILLAHIMHGKKLQLFVYLAKHICLNNC